MAMNYARSLEYLNSFLNYENVLGTPYIASIGSLEHMERLLEKIGKPHLAAKTVHIAGTNGKGSVAAMIAQVLSDTGYRTGLYTSPHLHSIRERIIVGGVLISEKEFAGLLADLRPHFEQVEQRKVSFFEALTVLAFTYFARKEVDFQVLETGLGGRLDATNVTYPEVCVVTAISRDHTGVLGDRLEDIAHEKAGIIKAGVSVVTSPQPREAAEIIRHVCLQRGAKLVQVGKEVAYHKINSNLSGQTFLVEGMRDKYHITIPLLGNYQGENMAAAVAALELLAMGGYDISSADIVRGMSHVKWPARFQILQHHPLVLVDGAHNVASMGKLVDSIKNCLSYEQAFLITGMTGDKDISGIIREMIALTSRVIVTRSSHPRAATIRRIAEEFSKCGISPDISSDIPCALQSALSLAKKDDLICITGSLFVAAEALDYFSRE
jgi:dihydrofolate synthase / folylpolyglutamate synthase